MFSSPAVRLGEANRIVTLFFYFSHICASGSSAPLGTLPAHPLDLIRWLTFQVSDQWNSINLSDFSGTRPVEFQRSRWFFKCQTTGIPLIWSLKFQNTPHLSTLSMNWAELHFWLMGHLSNGITFKKIFSSAWKLMLYRETLACTYIDIVRVVINNNYSDYSIKIRNQFPPTTLSNSCSDIKISSPLHNTLSPSPFVINF